VTASDLSANVVDHQFNVRNIGTIHVENVAPDSTSKNHVTSNGPLHTSYTTTTTTRKHSQSHRHADLRRQRPSQHASLATMQPW